MTLLCAALTACGGPVESQETAPELATREDGLANVRLRLMAANITSGNGQDYDPGHGIRIFQGTDADVVMIQEFNYKTDSAADLRSFVDTAFGTGFSYYREAGAQIPNGIISRYPIIAAGEWDDTQVSNRDFAWARINIPGPKDLWVVSVHLLTSGSGVRNTEASNLVRFINANVPAGDFLAIGGDFNTGSRNEATFSTFSSVVSTASPYPADRNGNTNTNAGRNSPYDHVLVDNDLRAYQTSVIMGSSTFANGLVLDTRVYSPLSDISPALSGDSGASGMQHMGVIKDFLIPGDGTTSSSVTVLSPNGGESWTGGSARTISWTASGISNVKVEYSLNGSTWTTVTTSTSAASGSVAWTVPGTASTSAWVRVSDASNAALNDLSNGAFAITTGGGSGGTGQVFINEVLLNEAGSDVNGEFVELVNTGTAAVDLSGYTLSDSASVRHTFPSGTTVAAGKAVVVFGGASGIPSGTVGATAATTGTLGLSNSGDTVTLKSASGATVDSATFASGLAGTDGVSANRSPDVTAGAGFALHSAVSGTSNSPGRRANGSAY
ncbi:lamin tail domain-containing protein [Corallococcus soli]|uniref:lamin tail domain-containing protein n=1 Tax=Corallococcus soli TaxID=2710757 RepID=UPI001D04B203|nr:lamin tail domain-containing protein [Corallococcus soli]